MIGHLGRTAGAADEVLVDRHAFVVVDGIEGVDPEQFDDFFMREFHYPPPLIPAPTRSPRIFFSPARIRLFTVPSGVPNRSATSR